MRAMEESEARAPLGRTKGAAGLAAVMEHPEMGSVAHPCYFCLDEAMAWCAVREEARAREAVIAKGVDVSAA